MFTLSKVFFIFCIFQVGAFTALAKDTRFYDGVNIAPLVYIFESKVKGLSRPIYTYHWSTYGDTFDPSGPPSNELFKNWGRAFWKNFGKADGDSKFGEAFYVSVDPISSLAYGGSVEKFELVELQLPVNLKLLNGEDEYDPYAEPVHDILTKFNCPIGQLNFVFALLGGAGSNLDPKCRGLSQEIFQKILKIDAIVYPFGLLPFADCKTDAGTFSKAFVILNPDWIRPNQIKVFNENSRLYIVSRTRIQALIRAGYPFEHQKYPDVSTDDSWGLNLWPDVEIKTGESDTKNWIQKNLWSCDGKSPVHSIPY